MCSGAAAVSDRVHDMFLYVNHQSTWPIHSDGFFFGRPFSIAVYIMILYIYVYVYAPECSIELFFIMFLMCRGPSGLPRAYSW
jgi:hypothetical protein